MLIFDEADSEQILTLLKAIMTTLDPNDKIGPPNEDGETMTVGDIQQALEDPESNDELVRQLVMVSLHEFATIVQESDQMEKMAKSDPGLFDTLSKRLESNDIEKDLEETEEDDA